MVQYARALLVSFSFFQLHSTILIRLECYKKITIEKASLCLLFLLLLIVANWYCGNSLRLPWLYDLLSNLPR